MPLVSPMYVPLLLLLLLSQLRVCSDGESGPSSHSSRPSHKAHRDFYSLGELLSPSPTPKFIYPTLRCLSVLTLLARWKLCGDSVLSGNGLTYKSKLLRKTFTLFVSVANSGLSDIRVLAKLNWRVC